MIFGKKKVSIDFTEPEYALLADRAKKEGISNSAVVNGMISLFFRISPDVAKKIGNFCYQQYLQEKSTLELLSGFDRDEAQKRMTQFGKISSYFGYDTPSEKDNSMKITFLKNGYVTYPKDWIVLDNVFGSAENCMYAGCVESRNSKKFGIPHFIFFCDMKYGKDYTDEMSEKIYSACAKAYPKFREFYNMEQPMPDPHDKEALQRWNEAPCFGLFHIVEKGDPIYWHDADPDYQPPYGAVIIRDDEDK